jgi:hypothetical protein
MNAARELEDRYRRLLALYPAEHRAEHEEEMLGVLLTAAPAGQRRPRPAESAALIGGAIRIWLRPGRGPAFQRWQDGLAAVSVLLPLLLTTYWAIRQLMLLPTFFYGLPLFRNAASFDARTTGPWLIVTVLVLFRLRWPAVVVAAAAAALSPFTLGVVTTPHLYFISPEPMLYAAGLGLEITALVASPGPRRGRAILNWKQYAGVSAWAVTISQVLRRVWVPHPVAAAAIIITVSAAGLALLAASPCGRRGAALLLIPGYYLALEFVMVTPSAPFVGLDSPVFGWEGLPRIMLTCAPLAIATSIAAIMAARYIQRPRVQESVGGRA